jgi:hypothetical protein
MRHGSVAAVYSLTVLPRELQNAMDMKKYKRKRSYSQVPYGNDRCVLFG